MSKSILNKTQLQYFFESRRKFDQVISEIMGNEVNMSDFPNELLTSLTKEDPNPKKNQELGKKAECWEKLKQFMEKYREKLCIKPCKFRQPDDKVLEEIQEKLEKYFLRQVKTRKSQSQYELQPPKKKVSFSQTKKLQQKINELEFSLFQKHVQIQNLTQKLHQLQPKNELQPVTQNLQQLQLQNKELRKHLKQHSKMINKLKKIITIAKQINLQFMETIQKHLDDNEYELKRQISPNGKLKLKNNSFKVIKYRNSTKFT